MMKDPQNQIPDLNRLSILVGTILLAYALTQFVSIPAQEFEFSILGIIFPIRLNFPILVSLLVAALTASGTAWFLEKHPSSDLYRSTAVNWLLPSLTSLVLLLAIEQLPFGRTWWLAAGASGLILTLVLVSEYIVLENTNPLFAVAELLLTAIAVALFLILAIALHASETRLFYRIPILSFAALLVYLRVLHLRKDGYWALALGSASFLLIGELAAGLHYWPIDSIDYGIVLTGPLYALIEISDQFLIKGMGIKREDIIWPLIIIVIAWGSAFII
jgi:hypothetical protein